MAKRGRKKSTKRSPKLKLLVLNLKSGTIKKATRKDVAKCCK